MNLSQRLSVVACITISAFNSNAIAADCSPNDVDHYLDSGFSHEQIVKLCTGSQDLTPAKGAQKDDSQPNSMTEDKAPIESQIGHEAPNISSSREDEIYFETVIVGNPVSLTPEKLIFERKECVEYGEINISGIRDKVCVNTLTTIDFDGLQILEASKAVFLIREQTLRVKGTISRVYLDISKHKKHKAAEIKKQLSTHPAHLNIPVTQGIDPQDVALRIKRYL